MKLPFCLSALLLLSSIQTTHAAGTVELDSIYIKGNKEFPQVLYIVPWKDMKAKGHREQTLVLHSLFGDLFDPVYDEVITSHGPAAKPEKKK